MNSGGSAAIRSGHRGSDREACAFLFVPAAFFIGVLSLIEGRCLAILDDSVADVITPDDGLSAISFQRSARLADC
jgi:hypothetical protein